MELPRTSNSLNKAATPNVMTARPASDPRTIDRGHDCSNQPCHQSSTTQRKKDAFFYNRKKLRTSIVKATAKVDELTKLEKRASTSFLESKKPIFIDPGVNHPLNFLEMLYTYLKRVPTEDQIETAYECLSGYPKDWVGPCLRHWTKIDEFKDYIMVKFWGHPSQNALRKKIISGSYSAEDGPMARYLIRIVSQAKWMWNPIPEEELVLDIMTHFPKDVQIGWYSSEKRTVIEAVEFLRRIDEGVMLSELREENMQKKYVRSKYKLRVKEISGKQTSNGDVVNLCQNSNKRIKLL